MNYAELKEYDIANGPGVRLSLFVSGCTHHCKGCFNEMTWDFHYGAPFTAETEDHILSLLEDVSYRGLTLLGGEPMEPGNQRALLPFLRRVRENFPKKDIWCFTGYLMDRDLLGWDSGRFGASSHYMTGTPARKPERAPDGGTNAMPVQDAAELAQLQRPPAVNVHLPETQELLSLIDVLVDGEFMEQLRDITLLYKGSSNQRTIDVPRSLETGRIIQWNPGDVSMSKMAHL